MIQADLESDGKIWLVSDYRDKERIRSVPGTQYSPDRHQWWCRKSWSSCVQLRAVFGDELVVHPTLNAYGWMERNDRVTPCLALRDAETADLQYITPADLELMPRQKAGTAFLTQARRAALCDGMGSGKTIQLIAGLEELQILHEMAQVEPDAPETVSPYPALVICPNTMKRTWAREFQKWAPHRIVQVIAGPAGKRRKQLESGADVLVMNWEQLRGHSRIAGYGYIKLTDKEKEDKELQAITLNTVIADEAHRAKSPKAKQTRALWAVAKQTTYRYAATGTPIANSPEDMWSIMHFLEPNEWPSKVAFITRYAQQSWNAFGGMDVIGVRTDRQDELFQVLDPRFIRRPTKIVVPGLPDKLPPQIRYSELGTKQRKAYDSLKKHLLAELDGGVLMATNPLTRMTRLLQLAAAYAEFTTEGDVILTEPSSKLDALDEVYEEIGPDEPLVVFAESRQLIDLAAARATKHKIEHGLITGAIDEKDRDVTVNSFQAGNLRLILATLAAGGEGITLTAAKYGVFLQRSYSMVRDIQAEERIWRKGQTRETQIIDIISPDTVEAGVHDAVFTKKGMLEEIVRDEETLRAWLSE